MSLIVNMIRSSPRYLAKNKRGEFLVGVFGGNAPNVIIAADNAANRIRFVEEYIIETHYRGIPEKLFHVEA